MHFEKYALFQTKINDDALEYFWGVLNQDMMHPEIRSADDRAF
jgi:hypothetical protein